MKILTSYVENVDYEYLIKHGGKGEKHIAQWILLLTMCCIIYRNSSFFPTKL